MPERPLAAVRAARRLKYSLAAADVHVVTLGNLMAGIVHPCKVYGAMAAGRPVLFFGPAESHVADLLGEEIGWQVEHGDVDGAVRVLRGLLDGEPGDLDRRGGRARRIVQERLTRDALCGRLCDAVEGRGTGAQWPERCHAHMGRVTDADTAGPGGGRRRVHRRPPRRRPPAPGVTDVRSVDVKPMDEWYQVHPGAENVVADLNLLEERLRARLRRASTSSINLACNMGGMGFIENNKGLCMLSVLINTHLLMAARRAGVRAVLLLVLAPASTTATSRRTSRSWPLKEEDAYPALPEDGYGWEKLFSERMCRHFREDFKASTTRVARFHNVYGPLRHLGGRPREGAGRDVPQGDRGQALRQARDRDLGRRQADPLVHVHRRLPQGHLQRSPTSDTPRPDQPRLQRGRDDQPARRHRRGHRRHQARSASTTSTRPRA